MEESEKELDKIKEEVYNTRWKYVLGTDIQYEEDRFLQEIESNKRSGILNEITINKKDLNNGK